MITYDITKELELFINLYETDCDYFNLFYENYFNYKCNVDIISDILFEIGRTTKLLFRNKLMTDKQINYIVEQNDVYFNELWDLDNLDATEIVKSHIELVNKYIKKSINKEMYEISYNLKTYLDQLKKIN